MLMTSLITPLPASQSAGEQVALFEPGVLLKRSGGKLTQRVYVKIPGAYTDEGTITFFHSWGKSSTSYNSSHRGKQVSLDIPVSIGRARQVVLVISDTHGRELHRETGILPVPRRWTMYIVPFTHTDIGFTQSQRKVLAQNLENLEYELDLVDKTASWPKDSRFKLFTEVSWQVDEFFKSHDVSRKDKVRLMRALMDGNMELGAFYISHQNRFMPASALFSSTDTALRLSRYTGVPVMTGCIHDVFDFSSLVKPLAAAGARYCIVGPNDTRYVVPPLFYLQSPAGTERVLVWHTPGLNGYGENFDLHMRLSLPFKDEAWTLMERSISRHLSQMQDGYPTKDIQKHFDYYGEGWEYPYDMYLMPFYPTKGGDNQPQTIVPSELVKKWNETWESPRLVIATPSEFFSRVARDYASQIPVIQGDMAGFWGEQIYLDMVQVDPVKEAMQQQFERNAVNSGIMMVDQFLGGKEVFNPMKILRIGYAPLILNNDHNPRPVPFGKTHYTDEDVQEWMDTRQRWIHLMDLSGQYAIEQARRYGSSIEEKGDRAVVPSAKVRTEGDTVVVENQFYRMEVEKKSGGIRSLYDLELNRELVDKDAPYLANQYVMAARGECAGTRDRYESAPGFDRVSVSVESHNPGYVKVIIRGRCNHSFNGLDLLSEFFKQAFGISIPPFGVGVLLVALTWDLNRPLDLEQEIVLPADKKRVDFVQRFTGNCPQVKEHLFAYPLEKSFKDTLMYDKGHTVYRFAPAMPWSNGDIIPAARMIEDFRSINDTLYPFKWMHGIPPGFNFDTFVAVPGDGCTVLFTSNESKVIIPGSLDKKPLEGPFGGGFYHCTVGWTMWGFLGLGVKPPEEIEFHSSLTSFRSGENENIVCSRGREMAGFRHAERVNTGDQRVEVVRAWPEDNNTVILWLREFSGQELRTSISFNSDMMIQKAWEARSDGASVKRLAVSRNTIPLRMQPGQLKILRVELLEKEK